MIDKLKAVFLGNRKRLFILMLILFLGLSSLIVYQILIKSFPDSAEVREFEEAIEAKIELEETDEVDLADELEESDGIKTRDYETIQVSGNPFKSLLEERIIIPEAGIGQAREEDLARKREQRIQSEIRSDYNVTGLVEQSHSTIAIVQRRSDGMTYMLRAGDSVNTIRVRDIRDHRVMLERDGVGVVYDLGEEED